MRASIFIFRCLRRGPDGSVRRKRSAAPYPPEHADLEHGIVAGGGAVLSKRLPDEGVKPGYWSGAAVCAPTAGASLSTSCGISRPADKRSARRYKRGVTSIGDLSSVRATERVRWRAARRTAVRRHRRRLQPYHTRVGCIRKRDDRSLSLARVLGRNFLRDVAPCTAIREFEGL